MPGLGSRLSTYCPKKGPNGGGGGKRTFTLHCGLVHLAEVVESSGEDLLPSGHLVVCSTGESIEGWPGVVEVHDYDEGERGSGLLAEVSKVLLPYENRGLKNV